MAGPHVDLGSDASPLFCARCALELHPGAGDFFQVTIEAVADPSSPILAAEENPDGLRAKIEQLMTRLGELSEREAMDQVHRRQILHLCNGCFRTWIENPTA